MNVKTIHSFDEIQLILTQEVSSHSATFILCDSNTNEHCVRFLLETIPALNEVPIIEIPEGEESKSLEIVAQLYEELLHHNADRQSLLLNVGGGVISDIGGFVASTYKRGIDFINIPTTVMAQVDAAMGGKCGIDLMDVKNAVGLFSWPKNVLVFTGFLNTLPEKELKSGFAEMLKHALIADTEYWEALSHVDPKDAAQIAVFVKRSNEIKSEITIQDPNEHSVRKKLNYGHTVGHAIESFFLAKSEPITHGNAVGWGIIVENRIALRLGILSESTTETIEKRLFNIFGLVPEFSEQEIQQILEFILNDKKNTTRGVNISLISEIGQCSFDNHVSLDIIQKVIQSFAKA
jgi:3-dehydroquinate synthase